MSKYIIIDYSGLHGTHSFHICSIIIYTLIIGGNTFFTHVSFDSGENSVRVIHHAQRFMRMAAGCLQALPCAVAVQGWFLCKALSHFLPEFQQYEDVHVAEVTNL